MEIMINKESATIVKQTIGEHSQTNHLLPPAILATPPVPTGSSHFGYTDPELMPPPLYSFLQAVDGAGDRGTREQLFLLPLPPAPSTGGVVRLATAMSTVCRFSRSGNTFRRSVSSSKWSLHVSTLHDQHSYCVLPILNNQLLPCSPFETLKKLLSTENLLIIVLDFIFCSR